MAFTGKINIKTGLILLINRSYQNTIICCDLKIQLVNFGMLRFSSYITKNYLVNSMNNFFNSIYLRSPIAIQNLMVTVYGWKLSKERYSSFSGDFERELNKSQWLSGTKISDLQDKLFINIAREAVENVPFYRNHAVSNGFGASDINSICDINRFPIIKKQYVRDNLTEFLSDKWDKKKLLKIYTSGTTGSPLTVYYKKSIRSEHYAFFTRLRSWFGVGSRGKRATLFGRVIVSQRVNKPPYWRYDYFQNNLLMSSYHLNKNNLIEYYNKLRSFSPEEVIGYPSSLFELANFIVSNGLDPLPAKVVFCTAETLYDYQASVLKKAFLAPIINQYGCTEMAFFASQCEHGIMHCHPEHGIMEILNERNEISQEGKGKLIATGLLNNVMPLIRYEVGDLIDLANKDIGCECGRNFPIINSIDGRSDDLIYTSDGTPIGRLDPVFKGGSGIVCAQLVQNQDLSVDIFVKPDPTFDDASANALLKEVKKRLGSDIRIKVILKEDLDRAAGGKFKSVIGNFKPR